MMGHSGVFEATGSAALYRAANHAISTGTAIIEAVYALEATNRREMLSQVESVVELQRLFAARLGGVLRHLGEVTP